MSTAAQTLKALLLIALLLGGAPLTAAESAATAAADGARVERLRQAGVMLTETSGVVTGAFIKDTVDMTEDNFRALGTLQNQRSVRSTDQLRLRRRREFRICQSPPDQGEVVETVTLEPAVR
jgi:hypothetical protein